MQDIIPPRKSIRDIPLPPDRQRKVSEIEKVIKKEREENPSFDSGDENYPPRRESDPRAPRKSRKVMWTIIIAIILGIGLSFLLYSKASIAIVTKNQSVPVNLTATSTKDGKEGTIPYSIITLQKEESIELNGTVSTKQVEKKASGTITVYNNYSSEPQALIATTRFQTSDGLVYRIDKDITVPGQTTQNGQKVPGSIDAVVFADQAGPKYNIGKNDFIVPGFQGTAKADGFYAKSKTDMTGGYIGNETTVSDEEMNAKMATLKNTIEQELLTESKTETPDTFVFFPTGMVLDFTTNTESANGKAVLKGKGVALVPIFNKKMLTDSINQAANTNFKVLEGWENLQAKISNGEDLADGDFPDLILHLEGTLSVGQEINVGELQRQLAGKSKDELSKILSDYPSVESAKATIRPFWKSHFPNDAMKIEITLTQGQ